jgi:hypothetical protein
VERTQPAGETTTTRLYSLAPYPLLLAALLPGAETVTATFQPFVELVQTFNLPDWLVHWGHPGNMVTHRSLPPRLQFQEHSQISRRARRKIIHVHDHLLLFLSVRLWCSSPWAAMERT